eukprot:3019818-Rhodomonas_salina.1
MLFLQSHRTHKHPVTQTPSGLHLSLVHSPGQRTRKEKGERGDSATTEGRRRWSEEGGVIGGRRYSKRRRLSGEGGGKWDLNRGKKSTCSSSAPVLSPSCSLDHAQHPS